MDIVCKAGSEMSTTLYMAIVITGLIVAGMFIEFVLRCADLFSANLRKGFNTMYSVAALMIVAILAVPLAKSATGFWANKRIVLFFFISIVTAAIVTLMIVKKNDADTNNARHY